MLRVIPVLDLKGGLAVHARGGDRAHYRPVRSVLHEGSDPIGLARAFRDRLGAAEVYVADLDAIGGLPPSLSLFRRIAGLGLDLMVDAGLIHAQAAVPILEAGASAVVAGLETLDGPGELTRMIERHGPGRVVFSLDLRDGRPLVPTRDGWGVEDPEELLAIALDLGVTRLIVLDLARIGGGRGVGTLPLIERLHVAHPGVEILAGGGVAGPPDLARLERAGASAALVGSALHDGRIGGG